MNADQQQPPPQTRGTVLTMPPRGPRPVPAGRPPAPTGLDHPEPGDEPGYGHGV